MGISCPAAFYSAKYSANVVLDSRMNTVNNVISTQVICNSHVLFLRQPCHLAVASLDLHCTMQTYSYGVKQTLPVGSRRNLPFPLLISVNLTVATDV